MAHQVPSPEAPLLRQWLRPPAGEWVTAVVLLCIHSIVRAASLWRPGLLPISMVLLWPMPWLLSNRIGRRTLGLRATSRAWVLVSVPLGAIALFGCAFAAWALFGTGEHNWLVQHAHALDRTASTMPPTLSSPQVFWFLTIPAMVFSPLAEEFLFRGYLLRSLSPTLGIGWALVAQAAAFALLHLLHYGLRPFDPLLLLLWLPSMFGVAMFFGWLSVRSGSLWPPILAHSSFNLAMNFVSLATFG